MYSLDEFGEMIGDKVRFPAYAEAVARAVKPGDAVADIGSGPGILAFLACRAGARRVFAIEIDGIVDFARYLAAANGLLDRIEFLRGDSRQIRLPERVNVIVSDLRGALPVFNRAIATVNDARERFLAEGGIMIPQRDELFAAIVEAPAKYDRITGPWQRTPSLNLADSLPTILNGLYKKQFKPEHLISDARAWCTLDYARGASDRAGADVCFTVSRTGTGHGIAIWFETNLYADIGFSTAPSSGETVYGHVFLPWLEPVELVEGTQVFVELHADPVGSDYVWRWNTHFGSAGSNSKLSFQQSTFFGASFPPSSLRKRAAEFVPVLSEAGQAERWMLQAMNGQTTLHEIAFGAARMFPHVFPEAEEAFRRAGELAEKLAR